MKYRSYFDNIAYAIKPPNRYKQVKGFLDPKKEKRFITMQNNIH